MVNIIIPTYKARETLPDTLNSLCAQTKKMFYVTIVQDCDGEDYSNIIEEYSRRGLNIKLISLEKNVGPGMARQAGIDATVAEYIVFVDADDILMPRAIEVLTREANVTQSDIITSDFIAEKTGTPGMYMSVNNTPVTWCHGKIYKTQYLKDNNIRFLPEFVINEDSYFNLVAVNGTDKRMKITECTYLWRDNKNSITRSKPELDIFLEGFELYVKSQIYGLKKLYEIKPDQNPTLVAATIINAYHHIMRAINLNVDCTNILEIVTQLKDIPALQELFNTTEFWMCINTNLKASEIFVGKVWFYSVRFIDWFNAYVKANTEMTEIEVKDDIHS